MTEKKYMERQVQRFLEGRTTCSEEQELYARFAVGDVPRSLRRYKEMFAWYAGGMNEDELPAPCQPRGAARWKYVVAAACVCAAFGLGVYGFAKYQERQELYARYEGSFLIRNGKKITDLDKILPELQRVEREAWQEERRLQRFIERETDPATASGFDDNAPVATTL